MYIYFTMYEKEMFTFLQNLSKTFYWYDFMYNTYLCCFLQKKSQFFIFHNTQTGIKAEQHSKNSKKQ